ncbi:hypothetical protein [uncultured Cetobacterium sp.]|uniref:hypothetical protein n=1 Tax=uncultured Cetobacterium sp. TaxID=527638 RepID=UPI0025EEA23D|nr:hypothetical protein [uncultured Cetobacterium sp.]
MKKSLYLLAALSLLGTNVFAKEVVAEPVVETSKEVIVEPVVVIEEVAAPAWSFGARTYLETEDFDNGSTISGGDDEDGTFWGVGVSATKGKLTLDLNVERRFGGDLSLSKSDAEWESTRVDYKVRYQLFEKQAFHLKYRNETRVRDFSRDTYHSDWTRDRYELGTDFNHFNGLLAGWLVAGLDRDKSSDEGKATSRDNGWYWEGDFGPSFKLTDKLSFNPTLFTTGEMYDSYEMVETQIRIMMPYQATDKLTIMPRVRFTLDRTQDAKWNGDYIEQYQNKAGDRIRYELMANYVFNDQLSTFVGVAYESNTRTYKNDDKLFDWTPANGDHDIDLIWAYAGLNYRF